MEFIHFLKMSRRSASEVQSEIYLACDRKYIDEKERSSAYAVATESKRLINGMIKHLRGNSDDGK
jgi:four helix bundle protein